MYNLLLRNDRLAYNFEASLKVKGKLLCGTQGATVIGCWIKPTDKQPTMVQVWLNSLAQTLFELANSGAPPTSPEQLTTDNSSFTANTKFVQTLFTEKLALVVGGAPATLNTIKKIATAINNDPNFFTTIDNLLNGKTTVADVQKGLQVQGTLADNAGAWSVTLPNNMPQGLVDGMVVRIKSINAAPVAPTMVVTNATGDTAHSVVLSDGTALRVGDVPAGYWMQLTWSTGASKWLLTNPSYALAFKYTTNQEAAAATIANAAITPANVASVMAAAMGTAPAAIDTLAELAAAIDNNANYGTSLMNDIGLKANIDSPILINPRGATPAAGDDSDQLATTSFIKEAIAASSAASSVANATETIVGKIQLVAMNELGGSISTALGVGVVPLKQVLFEYLPKSNAALMGSPRTPTAPVANNTTLVANTEYVSQAHATALVDATTAKMGIARFADNTEVLNNSDNILVVTPSTMSVVFAAIPTLPDSTTMVSGIAELATQQEATDGLNTTTWLTPLRFKQAIDSKLSAYSGSFAAPILTGAITVYIGSSYTLQMAATPAGLATNIASFDLLVKSRDSSTWQVVMTGIPATNNQASYVFTPDIAKAGIAQFKVTAKDNAGNVSPLASKDVSVEVITVNNPVILFPTNNQTGVSHTPVFEVNNFGLSVGVGIHTKTDWKLELVGGSGIDVLVWESPNDTVNKLTLTLVDNIVAAGYTYRLSVRFHDQTNGPSLWTSVVYSPGIVGSSATIQTIISPAPVSNGRFGVPTCSRTGDWLAVGSYSDVTVKIYQWDEVSSSYQYVTSLAIDEPDPQNYLFGLSVSMNGDGTRLVVGSPRVSTATTTSGSIGYVYVYERAGNAWAQHTKFRTPFTALAGAGALTAYDCVAVSADGNHIAAGLSKGALQILKRNSSGVWVPNGEFANSGYATDYFGQTLAFDLTATRLVVGAMVDKLNGSVGGQCYVYTRGVGDVWAQEAVVHPTAMSANELFGRSLCINSAGNKLYVSSVQRSVGALTMAGVVTVFSRTGTVWSEVVTITEPTPAAAAGFGASLSISENGLRMMVSAVYAAVRSSDPGHVYFASVDESANTITFEPRVNSPDTAPYWFGFDVLIAPTGRRAFIRQYNGVDTLTGQGKLIVTNC